MVFIHNFSNAHLGDICSDWHLFASIADLGYYCSLQHLYMQSFEERLGSSVVGTIHQWVSSSEKLQEINRCQYKYPFIFQWNQMKLFSLKWLLECRMGGLVLDAAVDVYKGFVVFQPIINGIGGNLVSVQASKISTMLHQSSIIGIVPPHTTICEPPWRALIKGGTSHFFSSIHCNKHCNIF